MALGAVTFGNGLASGINFRAIVDAIIRAEGAPIDTLKGRIDDFTKGRNSFNELNGLLQDFQSKLEAIKSEGTFGGFKATFDAADGPISASAGAGASEGAYEINVTRIAQAERRKSDAFGDRFSPLVSDGTITIKAGSNDLITVDVSAANGNNSLSAIADSINSAKKGVSASIVNDGSGEILILKSQKTGTNNALTISDSTNLNLNGAGHTLQAAQNAALTVDGVSITSQTNAVSNAIQGVTLNLSGTTTSAEVLTVTPDTETTKKALDGFVDGYNKLNDYFQKNFGTAAQQKNSAIAAGTTVRTIQREVQDLFSRSVTGVANGNLSSLAELGVTVADSSGKLKFDSSRFNDLIDQGRYDEVRAVLLSSGSTSDAAVHYRGAASSSKPGVYAVHVTTAGEQANVAGSTALNGGITQNETLTVALGSSSADIALTAGDTLSTIVTKLNTGLQSHGISVTAYAEGGKLKLRSNEYGAQQSISVTSSVADAADGHSTGFDTTAATDSGVDIVGTLGGVAAQGRGNELIGADGSDADGIRVAVYATAASITSKSGNFGTVGFSQGVTDRIIQHLDDLTDPFNGPIKSAKDAYDASIKTAQDKVAAIQDQLDRHQELLIKQFSAAEQAISQLQQFQNSLGASTKQ